MRHDFTFERGRSLDIVVEGEHELSSAAGHDYGCAKGEVPTPRQICCTTRSNSTVRQTPSFPRITLFT